MTTLTIDLSLIRVTGPEYYRTFAGYEIPFHPVDRLSFGETEGLRSYYLVYRDQAGRVIRFDKLRVVRREKEPRQLALPDATRPGTSIYFAVGPTGEPDGNPSAYADIGSWTEEFFVEGDYFAGEVDSSGQICKIVRLRVDLVFGDVYNYWPNGRLRTRTKIVSGQTPTWEYFDKEGNTIANRVPYEWESIWQDGFPRFQSSITPALRATFDEALRVALHEESILGEARFLVLLSRLDLHEGRTSDALAKTQTALQLFRAIRQHDGIISCWFTFGLAHSANARAAISSGRIEEAKASYASAIQSSENAVHLARRCHEEQLEASASRLLAQVKDQSQGLPVLTDDPEEDLLELTGLLGIAKGDR